MEVKPRSNATAVILDDHKMFAASFAMLLERTGLFEAVQAFNTEAAVMEYFIHNNLATHYLFLDYFMPGCNPIFLMGDIRRFCPSVRVVMVSGMSNPALIRKLLLNKVNGFISKSDGADQILACLKALSENKLYYSDKIKQIVDSTEEEKSSLQLSSRELEVLAAVSWGKSVDQISAELNISVHTVITHRKNLLSKSGCHSVAELVGYAIRAGILAQE